MATAGAGPHICAGLPVRASRTGTQLFSARTRGDNEPVATVIRINSNQLAGDTWGGLAAMLVALPSAIAFGVTIFAPLGGSYGAEGALAGILGATALGLVASTFGGTQRLITAPCAPAAAVLSALAIELVRGGTRPETVVLMLALVALASALLQIAFGVLGLGRLIKYMPYPVVSGYLSGVGLIIIISQLPKLLGIAKGAPILPAFLSPSTWRWQGVVVGLAAITIMILAPRFTKVVPAPILALFGSVLAYFALALGDVSLLESRHNALIVGPLGGSGSGFLEAILGRWRAVGSLDLRALGQLLVPAATLAVLLSIDTLKTCVVLDALTRSRHDSNRELIGQGLGNLASTAIGGMPGAGTMGATLVNISSGGQTRLSSVMEGALALVAFLLLGSFIAWVPIAALSGILIVVGYRMFDRHSLLLARSRSTILDFVVIVSVVVVAVAFSLIAASAVGVVLAILLFVREQTGGSIVRRRATGNRQFSKQVRLPREMAILEEKGSKTAIFELQGSLFFGTTDQLYTALEADMKGCRYLILDLRRVQSVDVTAAHMLDQIADTLADRGAFLLFCSVPRNLPTGQDMREYVAQIGLDQPERRVETFGDLDDALEWVEERILLDERLERPEETLLELREIDLFKHRRAETLAALEACMEARSYKVGERIFSRGDQGDEILLIRRGAVRIVLPLGDGEGRHLATFNRGDFFGEMSFLDHHERSADAIASTDTELFVLSRQRFDKLADEHKRLALNLIEGLARVLAIRLRYANASLENL